MTAQIIEKYGSMVYRLAIGQAGNQNQADAVFKKVFLKYNPRKAKFKNEIEEKRWFINKTIRASKRTVFIKKENWSFGNTLSIDESEVLYAILELPKKIRPVVYFYFYENLGIEEISVLLGCKQSTIKKQLLKARISLRNKLKEGFYDE